MQSRATGQFYVGATTNLQRRLEQHAAGTTISTRRMRPWRLLGYEIHASMRAARTREVLLKRNPRMRFFLIKRAVAGAPGTLIAPARSTGR
ncbi:MAG: GIY-YIG nuclease family protein [Candidatus Omnitrophica bacterium]|nr:GIY-YIG nuclease family protein [Candidatus Omnitrophota bacterium]